MPRAGWPRRGAKLADLDAGVAAVGERPHERVLGDVATYAVRQLGVNALDSERDSNLGELGAEVAGWTTDLLRTE